MPGLICGYRPNGRVNDLGLWVFKVPVWLWLWGGFVCQLGLWEVPHTLSSLLQTSTLYWQVIINMTQETKETWEFLFWDGKHLLSQWKQIGLQVVTNSDPSREEKPGERKSLMMVTTPVLPFPSNSPRVWCPFCNHSNRWVLKHCNSWLPSLIVRLHVDVCLCICYPYDTHTHTHTHTHTKS
jgi:hypothetical protein